MDDGSAQQRCHRGGVRCRDCPKRRAAPSDPDGPLRLSDAMLVRYEVVVFREAAPGHGQDDGPPSPRRCCEG